MDPGALSSVLVNCTCLDSLPSIFKIVIRCQPDLEGRGFSSGRILILEIRNVWPRFQDGAYSKGGKIKHHYLHLVGPIYVWSFFGAEGRLVEEEAWGTGIVTSHISKAH